MDDESRYIILTIANRRDRWPWKQNPPDFEMRAVRAAFQDTKKHFPKKAIRQRIAASKAVTFEEFREAINS